MYNGVASICQYLSRPVCTSDQILENHTWAPKFMATRHQMFWTIIYNSRCGTEKNTVDCCHRVFYMTHRQSSLQETISFHHKDIKWQ